MSQPVVKTVDFLPDRYRQANKRRRVSYWRGALVVLFVAVFAAAAGGVVLVQREVREEYGLIAAKHAAALAADNRLKAKEAKLAELITYADLLTFLRHPWPRSRIVFEIYAARPTSVTIESLKIVAEQRVVAATSESSGEATEKNAGTDLASLRATAEAHDVVVRIEGTTDDQTALHAYLQRLVGPGLFLDAKIEQIEAVRTAGVRTSKFAARIVVRPGWSLPSGPSEDDLPPLHWVEQVATSPDVAPATEGVP